MASSDDEDTYSSEENEASFASLGEESSYASSSSSEYRTDDEEDELVEGDDKENHDSDHDDNSLNGLIDPEADEFELKPARLNKRVEEAEPEEEPSDASLEDFGGDDEDDPQIDTIVTVVDVQELGEEDDDDEIVVVEAEIVVEDDDEMIVCAPTDVDKEETMMNLSNEPTLEESDYVDLSHDGPPEVEDVESPSQKDVLANTEVEGPQETLELTQAEREQEHALESKFNPLASEHQDGGHHGPLGVTVETDTCLSVASLDRTHFESSITQEETQTKSLKSPQSETKAQTDEIKSPEAKVQAEHLRSLYLQQEDSAPLEGGSILVHQSPERTKCFAIQQGEQMNALLPGLQDELKKIPAVEIAIQKPMMRQGAQDEEGSMISSFASLRLAPTSPALQTSRDRLSDIEPVADSRLQVSQDVQPSKTPKRYQAKPNSLYTSPITPRPSPNGLSLLDDTMAHDAKPRRPRIRREGSIKRGQWRLVKKIGSGSFGIVHMGINTHSGAMIAVKSVRMDAIAMKDSKREIQLLKALDHENVVQYFGAEMNGTHLHIFQEWIPAGSIASLLAMVGPFPLGVLREYLRQVLEGLAYLHENNVVHRDIKGSNLLVTDKGVVKLADFGAGKQLCKLRMESLMAMTCRGTPYFMAPEVFEQNYSAKADIWSVGCVGVQMTTGRPPWRDMGFSSHLTLFRHISSIKEPPPMEMNVDAIVGVHDGAARYEMYKELVGKCFHLTPSERPSCIEMMKDPFFQAESSWSLSDESECSSLFSPSPARKSLPQRLRVQPSLSPIQPRNQIKSCTGSVSSPFLSPPLPRNKRNSLTPDTSDWPSWAKRSHANAEKTKAERSDDAVLDPLSSLSYSQDGQMKENQSSRTDSPTTGGNSSALLGLDFVNSTISSIREESADQV